MTNVFTTKMLFFSTVVTILYTVLSPYWLRLVAFGFNQETKTIATNIVWILSPVIALFVSFSIYESIFLSEKKPWIPSLVSLVASFGPLLGILLLTKHVGIYGVAIGTTMGVLLSVIISYLLLIYKDLGCSLTIDREERGDKRIGKNLIPLTFYNVLLLAVISVDKIFAIRLGEGFTSALSYAFNISVVLPALVVPAVSNSVLPAISENIARNDYTAITRLFNQSFKFLSFTVIPVCALMFIFGDTVIQLLLHRGKFNAVALENTVIAFKWYIIGIPAYSLWGFVAGILGSLGRVKRFIHVSIFMLIMSVIINGILVRYLGYIGLPISTTIVFFIQLILFLVYLGRDSRFHGFHGVPSHFMKVSFATFFMIFVILRIKGLTIVSKLEELSLLYQVLTDGLLMMFGIILYLFISKWIKIKETSYIFKFLNKP